MPLYKIVIVYIIFLNYFTKLIKIQFIFIQFILSFMTQKIAWYERLTTDTGAYSQITGLTQATQVLT